MARVNAAVTVDDWSHLIVTNSGAQSVSPNVIGRSAIQSGEKHSIGRIAESLWAENPVHDSVHSLTAENCYIGYWGPGIPVSTKVSRRHAAFPEFVVWESLVTSEDRKADQVRAGIVSAMTISDQTDFEDGGDSLLAECILESLISNPGAAIDVITSVLPRSTPEVAEQVLRLIGESGGGQAINQKFRVLSTALESEIPIIRDGAIVGLVELDDARGVDVLSDRLKKENVPLLVNSIERAIALLQD